MAANPNLKLFKIASEINIGREAIVEFLQHKGFDIQNKPTAVLTEEMAELVYERFKREKLAAEKQREKLEKHHILRNVPHSETKGTKESSPAKAPQPEQTLVSKEIEAKSTEKIAAETKPPKVELKIVDKIDLDKQTKKETEQVAKQVVEPELGETKVQETIEVVADGQQKQTETEIQQPIVEKKEETHYEPIAKTSAIKPKEEDLPKTEQIEVQKDIKSKEVETTSEISTEAQAKPEQIQEKPKESGDKTKKKRQKLVEVVSTTAKIPGLTIVGKIDLEKGKKKDGDRSQTRVFDKSEHTTKVEHKKDTNKTDRHERRAEKPSERASKSDKIIKPIVQIPPATPTKTFGKDKDKDKELKLRKLIVDDEVAKVPAKVKTKDKSKLKEDKLTKKHKKLIREQISDIDIERAVRETMIEMDIQHASGASRAKIKQKKKIEREEKALIRQREEEERANILELTEFITTSELAKAMNVTPNQIILKCMQMGLMVTINQRLDRDTITLLAEDFGYQVNFYEESNVIEAEEESDREEDLIPRPPIVTIMGHVDHGKTSLLDYIRQSNVVAGEAGGITQHIGAYQVELPDGKMITFLDTPGHAAFTAMRARGAQVTDIVVLVVAADDSVMPQTVEAISHAKAAGVPIIIAINKIDKPDANPDRIKQQLADHGILVEDWGGKYQSVEISAKLGINVDQLLEKILIEAEILNLRANPNKKARGTVIEAVMKKGFGPVATIIIQSGTLKVGDPFVAGIASGRVKAMLDERENRVDKALPSDPVLVVGFDVLPEAGDIFNVVSSDVEARQIAKEREILKREIGLRQARKISLDDISQKIQEGNVKELKLIIKADVAGSVEALSDSLIKLSNDEVRVQIIHKGVGSILEADVILASASEAVIIGFNTSVESNARKLADVENVDIRLYNIIYDCINEVRLALEGLLSPEYQEQTTAIIEVRKIFKISKLGTIAGCYVQQGKVSKNDKIKVIRNGLVIHTGNITSLKREKDDVREVDAGYECGIMVGNFNGFEEGDILESYKVIEIKRKLQ